MEVVLDLWALMLVVGTIVGGVVYLRSALTKQRHTELKELADTRGEANADLRKEVALLREQVAELKGQMDAIQSIKAQEIAVEVARLLAQQLTRRREDFSVEGLG